MEDFLKTFFIKSIWIAFLFVLVFNLITFKFEINTQGKIMLDTSQYGGLLMNHVINHLR